jgi:hypothetical protein
MRDVELAAAALFWSDIVCGVRFGGELSMGVVRGGDKGESTLTRGCGTHEEGMNPEPGDTHSWWARH